MPSTDSTTEIWKAVPDYEGWYSVSDFVRIRRDAPGCGTWPGRILKPRVHPKHGYAYVILYKAGMGFTYRVHKLVASAFLGPCPVGLQVNHKDANKLNNRPENLEYVTPAGNIRHASENGLMAMGERNGSRIHPENVRGERNGSAKLTKQKVRKIRALAEQGTTHELLAARFSIDQSCVSLIVNRKRWAHVA